MRAKALRRSDLLAVASNSVFNHLASLRPVRMQVTIHNMNHPKRCCGEKRGGVTVTDELVNAVISHPHFLSDMKTYKEILHIDKLIINFGTYRTDV